MSDKPRCLVDECEEEALWDDFCHKHPPEYGCVACSAKNDLDCDCHPRHDDKWAIYDE